MTFYSQFFFWWSIENKFLHGNKHVNALAGRFQFLIFAHCIFYFPFLLCH